MKNFIQMVSAALMVVGLVACQQKQSGTSFGDRGTRAQNVSTTAVNSVKPTAVVYAYNQSTWMSSVRRLVSPSIKEEYLMDVSPDGSGGTGVYVGTALCMSPTVS